MKVQRLAIIIISIAMAVISNGCGLVNNNKPDLDEIASARPSSDINIYDYADLLAYPKDNLEEQLNWLNDKYNIELVFVTIPSLEGRKINQLAAEMFTNWNIGRKINGRGVLFLLAKDEEIIKLEVGYGLEGIFTDLFCSYVENKQIIAYLKNNQVYEGFSAVMEEFADRIEGRLTDEKVRRELEGYLSGGAGAEKKVRIGGGVFIRELPPERKMEFSAQPTPEKVLEVYRRFFAEYIADPDLGIYTEASREFKRYDPRMNKSLYDNELKDLMDPHKIFINGDYAVVLYTGSHKFDYGPTFMKKSKEGWQIDMISIGRWVRPYSGRNSRGYRWFIGGTNHPYMFAFKHKPYSYLVDDMYFFDYDEFSRIKGNYKYYIRMYEERLKENPDDFEANLELGQLFADLTVTNKAVPLLKKAIELRPQDPRAYWCLGLVYRDLPCEHKAALKYLKKYIELKPNNAKGFIEVMRTCHRFRYSDKEFLEGARYAEILAHKFKMPAFGYNWAGYFYLNAKPPRMRDAKRCFEMTLRADPNDSYARDMLKRNWGR